MRAADAKIGLLYKLTKNKNHNAVVVRCVGFSCRTQNPLFLFDDPENGTLLLIKNVKKDEIIDPYDK